MFPPSLSLCRFLALHIDLALNPQENIQFLTTNFIANERTLVLNLLLSHHYFNQ